MNQILTEKNVAKLQIPGDFNLLCAKVLHEGLFVPILRYKNEKAWSGEERSTDRVGQTNNVKCLLDIRKQIECRMQGIESCKT